MTWIHHFHEDEAREHGMAAAVVLQHLRQWISANMKDGRNRHDGRTWTFNSVEAWQQELPFLTYARIRRALEYLVKREILVVGRYNRVSFDRTLWYAFKDESIWLEGRFHLSPETNPSVTGDEPIPSSLPPSLPKDGGTAPAKPAPSPPAKIWFNFETKLWDNITDEKMRLWEIAYPACDIERELAKMAVWLLENPAKRKSNYGAFIARWLTKAQDQGGTR